MIKTENCSPGDDGYEEISLTMSQMTPLVGLHGRVDYDGIEQLGLILLDTFSEEC